MAHDRRSRELRPEEVLRVVLVDADEDSRLRWKLALQASVGLTVVEARLIDQAMSLVRRARPYLVILDPKVPDWNEITVIQALKRWSPALLVATTPPTADPPSAFLEAGAAYYFDKYREFHTAMDTIATLRLGWPA